MHNFWLSNFWLLTFRLTSGDICWKKVITNYAKHKMFLNYECTLMRFYKGFGQLWLASKPERKILCERRVIHMSIFSFGIRPKSKLGLSCTLSSHWLKIVMWFQKGFGPIVISIKARAEDSFAREGWLIGLKLPTLLFM